MVTKKFTMASILPAMPGNGRAACAFARIP